MRRSYFRAAGCRLSVVEFGRSGSPAMVVLHGMRDHAMSLRVVAEAFPEFRVLVMDLRGHGESDKPGSYSMLQFVADLRALFDGYGLRRPVLVGHSLGGHIASFFAALYPDEIRQLILIDGLGPPQDPERTSIEARIAQWREQVTIALQAGPARRIMKDAGEALARLKRNNPKLVDAMAREIVDHGIEPHPEGGVRWKWDPGVNSVWGTFSHDDSEDRYGCIRCPVLIVTGENSLDYWAQRRTGLDGEHELHRADLERRTGLFPEAIHEIIPGAGHMIHYDEPDLLVQAMRKFLANEVP